MARKYFISTAQQSEDHAEYMLCTWEKTGISYIKGLGAGSVGLEDHTCAIRST